MYSKLQNSIGLTNENPKDLKKILRIESFYLIREAMNRFDYGGIVGIDYGGCGGPGIDEYDSEALVLLEFFEAQKKAGKTITKSMLYNKLLSIHKKVFSQRGDPSRCSLITEHIYNEVAKLRLFPTSRKSTLFNFYYKKRLVSGWPR